MNDTGFTVNFLLLFLPLAVFTFTTFLLPPVVLLLRTWKRRNEEENAHHALESTHGESEDDDGEVSSVDDLVAHNLSDYEPPGALTMWIVQTQPLRVGAQAQSISLPSMWQAHGLTLFEVFCFFFHFV